MSGDRRLEEVEQLIGELEHHLANGPNRKRVGELLWGLVHDIKGLTVRYKKGTTLWRMRCMTRFPKPLGICEVTYNRKGSPGVLRANQEDRFVFYCQEYKGERIEFGNLYPELGIGHDDLVAVSFWTVQKDFIVVPYGWIDCPSTIGGEKLTPAMLRVKEYLAAWFRRRNIGDKNIYLVTSELSEIVYEYEEKEELVGVQYPSVHVQDVVNLSLKAKFVDDYLKIDYVMWLHVQDFQLATEPGLSTRILDSANVFEGEEICWGT